MAAKLSRVLERRASSTPRQPWLFFPRGWQWRWLSWSEGRDALEQVCSALSEHEPDGTALSTRTLLVDPQGSPGSVLLLMAAEELELPWRLGDAPDSAPHRQLEYRVPRPPNDRVEIRASWTDGPGERGFAEPATEVPMSTGARDVAFLGQALTDRGSLAFLRWSIESGSALALEPDPAARLASLLWVRPTVLLAPAELEASLAEALAVGAEDPASRSQRRAGRRSRLRVLVRGSDRGNRREVEPRTEHWRERRVEVVEKLSEKPLSA